MQRRKFLGLLSISSAAAALGGSVVWQLSANNRISAVLEDMPTSATEMSAAVQRMSGVAPDRLNYLQSFQAASGSGSGSALDAETQLTRYLEKMNNFEYSYGEDVLLSETQRPLLVESFKRIDRVQSLVGHGNFNVLGFDDMLRYSRQNESVGAFTPQELDFLESLFFDDVERYGFYGEKVIDSLTAVVSSRDRIKVSRTGHFLFKGQSEEIYKKIRQDVGDSIVLTSGIRGIVKQTHLFLAKTIQSNGNLSLASRSLAPPGHSFHGVGDFDVGKVGFGAKNFTADFSGTEEFHQLVDLGYLTIRYPEENLLGVRYEPWHIKVV
ncbi:MAG: D-alanyl-D-alanine carboxypeptidase [Candidatus Azotimanducaceae bacterium]